MNLEKSQHVICCLRNNAVLEGIVENWSDDEVILLSLDSQSQIIIAHPCEDIVFVKIVLRSLINKTLSEIKENISNELKQALDQPEPDLRKQNINKLKSLLVEQDKKIIKHHTKNHQLGQPRNVEYYYPGTNIKQTGK